MEPKDKAWIDLVDPTDDMIKSISAHFHLDQSAVNLFNNKSKKPQIRVLDEHTFTILLILNLTIPRQLLPRVYTYFAVRIG